KKMSQAAKKRSIVDENRSFKEEWQEYGFVEKNGLPYCVLCKKSLASNKKSNVQRHFTRKHGAFAVQYPESESRKKALVELEKKQENEQSLQSISSVPANCLTAAAFAGTLEMIQTGRPLTDAAYLKRSLLKMAPFLFAEFKEKDKIIQQIQDLPLSARTVKDCAVIMIEDMETQLVRNVKSATSFSLILDELTDIGGTTQLALLTRYVCEAGVKEELLTVLPLTEQNQGEDIVKVIWDCLENRNLKTDNLISICMVSSLDTMGRNKEIVQLLENKLSHSPLTFHCIIHEEALCAQALGKDMQDVMSLVVEIVNFVLARAPNLPPFQQLLEELDSQYSDFLVHNNSHWLSRGRVLSHFANCLPDIKEFLEEVGIFHPELANSDWLQKFYFLVDITSHLHLLNARLQGQGNTVNSLKEQILTFELKLKVLQANLQRGTLHHFEHLRRFLNEKATSEPGFSLHTSVLLESVNALADEFRSRFQDFLKYGLTFRFMTHPHQMELGEVHTTLEMEVADFQEASGLVNKFRNLNTVLVDLTWSQVPDHYENMKKLAFGMLSIFGSTYLCEQVYSHVSSISRCQSQLIDVSLDMCTRLKMIGYCPNIEELSNSVQEQET
uniref:Uncharacterized protein n=1 Tax=Latimeria chalumnae TaxID=7897 RepID=H3A3U8_LATCH